MNSKLFKENKSVVFKHKDIVRKWDNFEFISCADSVISHFYDDKDIRPLSLVDFRKQNIIYSFLQEEQLVKEYRNYLKRSKYELFFKKYEITPNNFKRIFNSIMREIWVVEPYYSKFCFLYKKPKPRLVEKLHKILPILQKTKRKNILPIVFWSGFCENSIESIFGQKLWTEICCNSEHKNTLLSRRVFSKSLVPINSIAEKEYYLSIKEEYKKWNKIKPTVLKKLTYIQDFDLVFILCRLFKAKDLNINTISYGFSGNETEKLISKIMRAYSSLKKSKEKYDVNWEKEDWIKIYNSQWLS